MKQLFLIATFAFAAILVGCGGGSAATNALPSAPEHTPIPPATAMPSANYYTFAACCTVLSLQMNQTPVPQAAVFEGMTTEVIFGQPNVTGSVSIGLAVNVITQIMPATLPVDNAQVAYLPVEYISIYNGGMQTITFSNTPEIVFTEPNTNYMSCSLDAYSTVNNQWSGLEQGSDVTTTATIGPAQKPMSFPPGQSIFAISCK